MLARPIYDCGVCPIGTANGGPCPFSRGAHPAGTTVCPQAEGDPPLLFLRQGYVAMSAVAADGADASFALRGPGSLLTPEVLSGASVDREVRALTAAMVCSLPSRGVERWLGHNGGPARALLALVVAELEHERFEQALRRGPCLRRVAAFALAYDGVVSTDRRGVTKAVAARLLDIRPETFSRCVRELSDHKLVDSRRGLRVLDPSTLEALSHRNDL